MFAGLRRLFVRTVPLVSLLLIACPAPADLELDVSALDFGEVAVGSSLALPVSITNVGEFTATVSFRIAPASVYSVDLPGAVEVLPGGTRVLHVYADPTEVGPATSTLTFTWNASDSASVPLSVVGVDLGPEDADRDGYPADVDCDDLDPTVNPGADEVCDGVDNDCSDGIDEGFDADSDGVTTCGPDGTPDTADDDCDDTDPAINPSATETCDGVDNNCDGAVDDGFDADADGSTVCDGDCDDDNPLVFPGNDEICDGVDNNCNNATDEGFDDADGDGQVVCLDCDDADPNNYNGNVEVCDGADNDCDCAGDSNMDGTVCGAGDDGVDENAVDADNDGFGCLDCDDQNPAVFPGAAQACDGVLDNDCDSVSDPNELDTDADGATPCAGDCDDADPSANLDDLDNDGVDTCGADGVAASGDEDCDDNNPNASPLVAEACDGIDNNCDGAVDEGSDADNDSVTSCGPDGVPGTADDDCDDGDPAAYPGAPEACGGAVDLNCDGALPAPCTGDDCADVLASSPGSPDGVYTVDPAGNGVGFDVWCDMTTDGGGWTMVMRTTSDGTANAALAAAGSYQAVHDDFVPSVGYDPDPSGGPARVPAQYWDDFADVGEIMVRHELLKQDGTVCSPLHFSLPGTLTVPAVSAGLNITFSRSAADPHDIINGTQAGTTAVLQTTDRWTVSPGCVPTNGAAPWFMGTCNGGLMPAQGTGFWSSGSPLPVVYFDRVTLGTDLNGSDFATACGGAAMTHPPSSALGPASAWYTHATLEYYFR